MNNSVYEEYMRNVLGYNSLKNKNTYKDNYDSIYSNINILNADSEQLEKYYPDIYRLVYPMVQSICEKNSRRITKDIIDEMTNEIYFAIEDNEIGENRGNIGERKKDITRNIENKQRNSIEVKNKGLNDLIKILIIREISKRRYQEIPISLLYSRNLKNKGIYKYGIYEDNI